MSEKFSTAIEAWKNEVKKKYPNVAAKLKFKARDRGDNISAEIDDEDRSYGVFDVKSGKGYVLGEEISMLNLLSISEAKKLTPELPSDKSAVPQVDISELEGKDIRVEFKTIKGRFGQYFSSVWFDGKLTKVDQSKKIFILEYDHFGMNDETVKGGPGDKIRPYKTIFGINDVESIDENRKFYTVYMKT